MLLVSNPSFIPANRSPSTLYLFLRTGPQTVSSPLDNHAIIEVNYHMDSEITELPLPRNVLRYKSADWEGLLVYFSASRRHGIYNKTEAVVHLREQIASQM